LTRIYQYRVAVPRCVRNSRHDSAVRLDAARDDVQRRLGTDLYRRFRPFLWGLCRSRQVQAYRWLLHLPA